MQCTKILCYIYEILLKAVFELSVVSSAVSFHGKCVIHTVTRVSYVLIIDVKLSNTIQYFVFWLSIKVTSHEGHNDPNQHLFNDLFSQTPQKTSNLLGLFRAEKVSISWRHHFLKNRMIIHNINTYTLNVSNIFHSRCMENLTQFCWPIYCAVEWSFMRTVKNTKASLQKFHHTEDLCWKMGCDNNVSCYGYSCSRFK